MRLKADAYLHAHGKPLKAAPSTASEQLLIEDFGCTYRERLLAVERELASHRRAEAKP